MAAETIITIVGNLTADPELRFTENGTPVANFTIASTPRRFDRQANEWKDGDTLFMRCSVWRDMAEHVSESLSKGMRVVAQGSIGQRSYEDKDGVNRTVVEMQVEEIGASLRYATAKVTRSSGKKDSDSGSESGSSKSSGSKSKASNAKAKDADADESGSDDGW